MGHYHIVAEIFEKLIRKGKEFEHDKDHWDTDRFLVRVDRCIIATHGKLSRHLVKFFIFADFFRHILLFDFFGWKIKTKESTFFLRFSAFPDFYADGFICQQGRAISTANGKYRGDSHFISISTLECSHDSRVIVYAALKDNVIPDFFRSHNFVQIVTHNCMTKPCSNVCLTCSCGFCRCDGSLDKDRTAFTKLRRILRCQGKRSEFTDRDSHTCRLLFHKRASSCRTDLIHLKICHFAVFQ